MGTVAEKTRALAEPVCVELGLELVDVEYRRRGRRWVLTILVDKQGGVTVEDLKRVSAEIDPLLDLEDFVPQQYVLEVSSPGVLRPLKRVEDYRRFCGSKVRVRLAEAIDNKRDFVARIQRVVEAGSEALIEFSLPSGQRIEAPFSLIVRANLHYTTKELFGQASKSQGTDRRV